MAISKRGVIPPWLPFLGVGFLTSFWFFGIIFHPDMLESESRALKTRAIA